MASCHGAQRRGQLSGKYGRGGATADSLRARRMDGPTERNQVVIDAVARVATAIDGGSAEVAWVRRRPAVTSTLIGARTSEHLRANLASLEVTLTPEHSPPPTSPSPPGFDFLAAITTRHGPMAARR